MPHTNRLTPTQARVVELLAIAPDKPRTGAWIAVKLDKQYGGWLRSVLAELVRAGVTRKVPGGGYVLAALAADGKP